MIKRLHLWLPHFWWQLFRCEHKLIIRVVIIDTLPWINFLFCRLERTISLLFWLFIHVFVSIYTDGLVIFTIKLHIILAILIVLVIEIALIKLLTISIRSCLLSIILLRFIIFHVLILILREDILEHVIMPILCVPGLLLVHSCVIGHFLLCLVGIEFSIKIWLYILTFIKVNQFF